MQKSSDNKVKKRVEKYFSQMGNTDSLWSYLSPNLVTQSVFEDLADTSACDYQLYLQALVNWHGDNQEFWFPYFFFKKEYKSEVLEDLSPFIFHTANKPFLKVAIYWLLTFLLTTFLLYIMVFKRGKALVNKKLNSF
ncbi:MAG: DUF3526 domain-containing protein [Lentisphaeraceae bacterium]|nr:DUF3526 domain-containing protein [Lentisphaeraceae bacterium]